MSKAYFIQFEDKDLQEGSNLATLAGISGYFSDLTNIVLSNQSDEIKSKYEQCGVNTQIYTNEAFTLTDLATITKSLGKLFDANKHAIFIFEDSKLGNNLASRLSATLDLPLVCHVTDLTISPNSVTVSRNIAESKAVRISHLKQGGVITASLNGVIPEHATNTVKLTKFNFTSNSKIRYIKKQNSGNDLVYAKTIVSGGKGLQDAEGFKPLNQLAKKLDASVGATKGVTDQGWVDATRMIGVSNLTVKPDVYYAFGISGAVQHTAGMDKSKHIIAVNTDKTAPIFKLADYGIVGDANQVIDRLINLL
ncbi:electron transfer flavoprotein subunit alpha/FixB family protein [Lactobacillus psittaci]|uniref:Electron transfer flavoprotein subunit alpha n=1 Tax=Lactobacillus psittaci DSM 15354 TaxID=1122152 RepID=A0A0R1S5W9_9LACO|nr:electron transfer flavoprotein subunit alpha/FixB family protein [Lactobacillus psittaci]KRL62250.1 hypothetical protein FC23_GL000335 [Lactobacillus psittaci DSM 15354]